MQILSVVLKNFKSHSDREFSFQLGTNAICGENGAGKSSILAAIEARRLKELNDGTRVEMRDRIGIAVVKLRRAFFPREFAVSAD